MSNGNRGTNTSSAGLPAEKSTIKSYRDLKVSEQAMDLTVECYKLTQRFPKTEVFGIVSQIRRSASSVPANIAEGHGREGRAYFIQFLRVAQGSLKELETHLLLSARVGFLDDGESGPVLRRCSDVGKMLRGLIRALDARTGRR
ncbi:MAG TPA: four helix bundle protein [Terriglobia bacterium]|nr:four helix bundle protein [Terriglobia bacterium]